jgi:hypothetical protein
VPLPLPPQPATSRDTVRATIERFVDTMGPCLPNENGADYIRHLDTFTGLAREAHTLSLHAIPPELDVDR